MFLGLPEAAESEGFDRETLDIPAKQVELLKAVAAENKNIVVVLSNGSVVSVAPWAGNAKGILESRLLGRAGGPALADVIFGKVSPSGKLAQTIPMNINDDPSMINWRVRRGTSTMVRACSSATATTTRTTRPSTTRSASA